MLARMGLSPGQLLRIEAAAPPPGPGAGGAPRAAVVATARAVVQGILDVSGAPPRRYLFQASLRRLVVAQVWKCNCTFAVHTLHQPAVLHH
jgi:hypothetical protein